MAPPDPPIATYRLQMHKGFTFRDASGLVPYLHGLGISHAYTSPILKARPGSCHGYDISNHHQLNPEIGTEEEFNAWSAALADRGMGILLDTVPNHMAVVGNDNPWWNDILENGPSSPYSGYFDIAWTDATRPELQGRILIPLLGDPYAKALESQQIRLCFEAGAFELRYFDHRFPVAPRSYGLILAELLARLESLLPKEDVDLGEMHSIFTAVKHLPRRTETSPALVAERQREKEIIKRRLGTLVQGNPIIRETLDRSIAKLNGVAGDPSSFDALEKLLDDQTYRLAFWRVASEEINYRRFFDVNELAALSMERADVFETTHELTVRLIKEQKIHGLRIDHPDGLFDPREYLARLQSAVGATEDRPFYVVVEKILGADESLPPDWRTAGETGYEFLNLVNGLFVDAAHEMAFTKMYSEWIGDDDHFAELTYQKKILILQIALAGEMQMLTNQLDRLAQRHRSSRDFTRNGLRIALREIIASFPVYRSYIAQEVTESDRRHVLRAVRRALLKNPALSTSIFHFIRDTLLLRSPGSGDLEPDYAKEQRSFVGKFQQVTSPVMAKAAEDTAGYVFNRLISLNEVGGDPDRFGVSVTAFHAAMMKRQATFPGALSATATHDTKRGEDVRARINVLSEIPDEWHARLRCWSEMNACHRLMIEDAPAPDRNEEWFLYQTLIGAWPADGDLASLTSRVQEYMLKALHEAKVHSSWINPNQAYDEAMTTFIARILDPDVSGPFISDVVDFHAWIIDFGMINSLGQTLLKVTCPGVPDLYQGCELWDLNLVDPDNRRDVDYALRRRFLHEESSLAELVQTRRDGRIKLWLTKTALSVRQQNPDLFRFGEYLPIEVQGMWSDRVISFMRRVQNRAVLVVVPRLLVEMTPSGHSPFDELEWADTTLVVGDDTMRWRSVFTNKTHVASGGQLSLGSLLTSFPFELLVRC